MSYLQERSSYKGRIGPDSFLNSDGDYSSPDARGNSPEDAAWIEARKNSRQDLFARGPFFPRLSLQRCVHARKKLAAIARQKRDVGAHQRCLVPLSNPRRFARSFSSSCRSFERFKHGSERSFKSGPNLKCEIKRR